MESMCSSHTTCCCCCPENCYRTVSAVFEPPQLRGCSAKWGGIRYVKISHYSCACSTGQIKCVSFCCTPSGQLVQVSSRLLAERREQFSFLGVFSLALFICRDISCNSHLCPNSQIMLIYFWISMQI